MKVTILGCGTSGGVPRIGNDWGHCDPTNPKNRRRRVSICVEHHGTRLIVDTSPDLREQCLDNHIATVDGVLYTHDHADHANGIDDLRAMFHNQQRPVDVFASAETLATLRRRFEYIFDGAMGYPAICAAHEISGPFRVGEIDIVPFAMEHGPITSLGFRFGPVAYATDMSAIPDAAFDVLQGVEIWIVDALRHQPHPTHPHLARTLEWIARVRPDRAILTHMTWDMDYETLRKELPAGVEPGYDNMIIEI